MKYDAEAYDMDDDYFEGAGRPSSRFSYPMSPMVSSLYGTEFGRSDPESLRCLSEQMDDLPDRRRRWLLEFADRIEAAGYESFAEVPSDRFDEITQLY
ncbi:hypothetical protein [Conyzicola sp.]|uniref:hypothetical protein n=1 Tax=Conyzicola sp. TaxID=1969404 RepID=UPI003989EB79